MLSFTKLAGAVDVGTWSTLGARAFTRDAAHSDLHDPRDTHAEYLGSTGSNALYAIRRSVTGYGFMQAVTYNKFGDAIGRGISSLNRYRQIQKTGRSVSSFKTTFPSVYKNQFSLAKGSVSKAANTGKLITKGIGKVFAGAGVAVAYVDLVFSAVALGKNPNLQTGLSLASSALWLASGVAAVVGGPVGLIASAVIGVAAFLVDLINDLIHPPALSEDLEDIIARLRENYTSEHIVADNWDPSDGGYEVLKSSVGESSSHVFYLQGIHDELTNSWDNQGRQAIKNGVFQAENFYTASEKQNRETAIFLAHGDRSIQGTSDDDTFIVSPNVANYHGSRFWFFGWHLRDPNSAHFAADGALRVKYTIDENALRNNPWGKFIDSDVNNHGVWDAGEGYDRLLLSEDLFRNYFSTTGVLVDHETIKLNTTIDYRASNSNNYRESITVTPTLVTHRNFEEFSGTDNVDHFDFSQSNYGVLINSSAGEEVDNARDRITGSNFNDSFIVGRGDRLWAGKGDDSVVFLNPSQAPDDSGTKYAYLWGGDGTDLLDLSDFNNNGNGVYYRLSTGTSPNGVASTGITFAYTDSFEDVIGTKYNDILLGSEIGNEIYGDQGDDHIYGNAGHDVLFGGEGNDTIYGGTGNDVINTGYGSDRVYGEDGNDEISVESDIDITQLGTNHHIKNIDGGAGKDTIKFDTYNRNVGSGVIVSNADNTSWMTTGSYSQHHLEINLSSGQVNQRNMITGGHYNQTKSVTKKVANITGIENVYGSSGRDLIWGNGQDNIIFGGEGRDSIYAEHGDDLIEGGAGADHIEGGVGSDFIVYKSSESGVRVDFYGGGNQESYFYGYNGDAQGDFGYSVENVEGSLYGDQLTGNSDFNVIIGNGVNTGNWAEKDRLKGQGGSDIYVVNNYDRGQIDIDLRTNPGSSKNTDVLSLYNGWNGELSGNNFFARQFQNNYEFYKFNNIAEYSQNIGLYSSTEYSDDTYTLNYKPDAVGLLDFSIGDLVKGEIVNISLTLSSNDASSSTCFTWNGRSLDSFTGSGSRTFNFSVRSQSDYYNWKRNDADLFEISSYNSSTGSVSISDIEIYAASEASVVKVIGANDYQADDFGLVIGKDSRAVNEDNAKQFATESGQLYSSYSANLSGAAALLAQSNSSFNAASDFLSKSGSSLDAANQNIINNYINSSPVFA